MSLQHLKGRHVTTGFAQAALDGVAHDGAAGPAGDGEPEARAAEVVRAAEDDDRPAGAAGLRLEDGLELALVAQAARGAECDAQGGHEGIVVVTPRRAPGDVGASRCRG